jgi:two-component system, OmpR family, sensor histidine kinase MprB
MSLRGRITAAVAIGVTAVVLVLAVVVYMSVRSHLRSEIDHALVARGTQFQASLNGQRAGGPPGAGGPGGAPNGGPPGPQGAPTMLGKHRFRTPTADPFGGAPGYIQFVDSSGAKFDPQGHPGTVPPTKAVIAMARNGSGHTFFDQTVDGERLRIYAYATRLPVFLDDQVTTVPATVEVARPLSEVDNVLHQLLYTFGGVIIAGILLALAMGAAISRTALAPIGRFINRTEAVTGALDGSERLEEGDTEELARLAASFNQTLDALEKSVASQRHLVADASHELRTPIAALRSNIQIFLDSGRLPPDERVGLQAAIIAELDELTQLVDDVLELSRGASAPEAIEELRLDTIVAEAIDRTSRRAPDLRFTTDVQPTTIRQVHERVARAVINILDNARKWSPHEGEVEVRLRDGVLEVRDHGPGFPERDLPHVFDRFYRAERSRTMPGSGLGLAIVRQTAKAGGGFAEAANAPDGGAIVRASFGAPIATPAEPATPAPLGDLA